MNSKKLIAYTVAEEVHKKINQGSHGVILLNLPDYEYHTMVSEIKKNNTNSLFFFVGFSDQEEKDIKNLNEEFNSHHNIFYTVEEAEQYRHNNSFPGTRIVIVKRAVAKLSSLLWYEEISTIELYKQLCLNAQKQFEDTNEPIVNLWKVINTRTLKEILSFEQIVNYFEHLKTSNSPLTEEVSKSLFLLGLIPDKTLLDSPKNDEIRKKLVENHKIVQRIRYLNKSDLKILQSIEKNLDIQEKILNFYKTRDNFILQNLSLDIVKELLANVNNEKKKTPVKTESNDTEKDTDNNIIRNNDALGVNLVLDNELDTISDLMDAIDEEYNNWETGKKNRVEVSSENGTKTKVEFLPEIFALINSFISDNNYGGIIHTDENNASDALINITQAKISPFNEAYIEDIITKLLFIKEEFIEEAEQVIDSFNTYLNLRKLLVPQAARLADSPMLKVAGENSETKLYSKYILAYANLISSLKEHYQKFSNYSAKGTKEIISQINSLDTIYIKSSDSMHAVLSPLNPLYLWKYIELAQRLREDNEQLNETDKEFLVRTADEIPNPLITLFVSNFISNDNDEVIVEIGKIGNLPLYSNDDFVNQSSDGLDTIKNSFKKFISVYKHSKVGLKVAFINPPDLESLFKLFTDLIPFEITGLHIDIFKTKDTPSSWADIDNIDEDLLKLFSSNNNYTLKIHNNLTTYDRLNSKFKKNPYHLVTLFDPSKRSISEVKAESRLNLKIHPLCIPKIFQYDPVSNVLEIVPATTGNMFTDHHELVARLNDRPKGWHNTVISNLEPLKENIESFMESSEWLILADNNLKNFEVSTIGSEKCIFYSNSKNREIGIYSNNWNKLILGLDKIIRRIGNYIPNPNCLEKLLLQIQLLNEKSILSLINVSSSNTFDDNRSKGTIGSAIAAAWYKDNFKTSLLASLDTDLARNWLKNRDEKTVSDLIGIQQVSESEAIIDILEVKTFEDFTISNEENLDGTKEISGQAVNQTTVINSLIKEILFEQTKITSISRRELLRFQVFKILHNSGFTRNEKKTWTAFLNNLFANNLNKITIRSSICYVNFNSTDKSDIKGTTYSSDIPVTLYQINNDLITHFISNCESSISINDIDNPDMINGEIFENNLMISEEVVKDHEFDKNSEGYSDENETQILGIDEFEKSNTPSSNEFSHENSAKIMPELESFINIKAQAIFQALKDYSIDVQEVDPKKALIAARFIRFRIKLRPGAKLSKVESVKSDIGREIEALNEIFVGNEKGSNYIYLDLPRESSENISLLQYIGKIENKGIGHLNVILGQNPNGEMIYLDLATAPHLLTAGSTGSGKTIFLYSIIVSLISQFNSDQLELVIIDPKQTDFIYFEELPHLRNNQVIIEAEAAVDVLNELVEVELQRRTDLLRKSRNRDLFSYNIKNPNNPLKPILVIVDEYADLIAAADLEGNKSDFEKNMIRLAQRSRNVGIHLVIATQRPSADIVTSRLKANVPTRISFSLPANQDSRTILDATGAEDLLGKGDMLYSYNGDIQRLQGLYIDEDELENFLENML